MIGDYRRPRKIDWIRPWDGEVIEIELAPLPRPPMKLGEPCYEPWPIWKPE